jgi:hypothetical protein
VAAKASNVASSEVAAAEATDVAAAEAVAAAKAAHVAAAAVSSSAAVSTAATGLCASGSKAAGKHGTCQDHHHSSSHDILRFDGRNFRHRASSDAGIYREGRRRRRDGLEMGMPVSRTIKFPFNHSG